MTTMMNGAEQDPRLKDVFFLVEATSFEVSTLWCEHSLRAAETYGLRPGDRFEHRMLWKQDNSGLFAQVGVDTMRGPTKDEVVPTCIQIEFYRIGGKLVLFWHATSAFVNHERITQWFDTFCQNAAGRCDAQNFSQCSRAIRDTWPPVEAKPVCTTCNDTHVMARGEREVPCTFCPVPCEKCRAGGNGPYCTLTPCACACHASTSPGASPGGGGPAAASDRAIKK